MKKRRILVIDDEPDILSFVSMVLTDAGYAVEVSRDARSGIDLMRQQIFDLVLLDIMLPDVDGWEIMKAMRADENLKKIPVAMLTARVDAHDKVIGLKQGAVDYICKPFTADQLLARVNEIFKYMQEEPKR
jgi:DNA-binding response OmpR family regulator